MYSYGHPGSFNPAVITNKEAHMIYGNMNNETGSSQAAGLHKKTIEAFQELPWQQSLGTRTRLRRIIEENQRRKATKSHRIPNPKNRLYFWLKNRKPYA